MHSRWPAAPLVAFVLLLGLMGCRGTGEPSRALGDDVTGSPSNPSYPSEWRRGILKEVLYDVVGEDLDGVLNPADARCGQSCHVHKNLTSTKLVPWFKDMRAMLDDCKVDSVLAGDSENLSVRAKAAAKCVSDRAPESGLGRALVGAGYFQTLFERAEMPAEHEALRVKGMPPPGAELGPMDGETSYKLVMLSTMYDTLETDLAAEVKTLLANEGGTGAPPDPLPTCKDAVSDGYKQHVKTLQTTGWSAKNANDPNFRALGCVYGAGGGHDPLACFNDQDFQDAAGKPLFPERPELLHFKKAKLRVLKDIGSEYTSYWMRASADGRYVAVGNRGFERLQERIDGQGPGNVTINASYDPGFFPGNQGFAFQGDEMIVCAQKILEDPKVHALGRIEVAALPGGLPTPETKYCSRTGNVSLYQSVGASLSGEDFYYLAGSFWEGDTGSIPIELPVDEFATADADVKLHLARQEMQEGGFGYNDGFALKTPWQGDWFLVPSGSHMVGRVATEGAQSVHDGYVIKRLDVKTEGDGEARKLVDVAQTEVARICLNGRKPVVSLDERWLATHHSVKRFDFKEYGFAAPEDPAFRKIRNDSTDIWLVDLLTGKKVRVTNVGPGRRALYPHFRADGWLYFLLKDWDEDGTSHTSYLATDAALRLK